MPRTGTGRVYQRGNVWWIQYGFRGRTYRETSKSRKRSVAVKLLRRRLAEMASGGPLVDEETVTFADLQRLHLTDLQANGRRLKWARTAWKPLAAHFAGDRAVDITSHRLKAYLVHRQEEGAANSTIQKELAAIRRGFKLAVAEEAILASAPAVPSVKVKNVRKGFFDPGDLAVVVDALPAPVAAMVRFAALTGWRKGEILPLQWSQVDFDAGLVRLAPGTTKNDEGREFPFRALPPLAELLEEQRRLTRALERERGRIIPHVFHRDGSPIRSFRGAWNAACKRAGVEGALFHDLRRTAVRNLERAGVPRSVAMKLTGHKTEAVYRRYAIADARALAEGVEKLARLHQDRMNERSVRPLQEATG
jgi:integrase